MNIIASFIKLCTKACVPLLSDEALAKTEASRGAKGINVHCLASLAIVFMAQHRIIIYYYHNRDTTSLYKKEQQECNVLLHEFSFFWGDSKKNLTIFRCIAYR